MAAFALWTESAVMDVILDVAAHAGAPRLFGAIQRFLVAVVAGHLAMCAFQGEPRLIVIEIPGFPSAGVMAGLALRAEASLVHVLLLVTAVASHGRIPKRRCQVALLAIGLGMAAGQRETRFIVVIGGVLPAFFVVATLAFIAELPFVLVVFLVAGDARGIPFMLVDIPLCGQMTGIAFGFDVLAL